MSSTTYSRKVPNLKLGAGDSKEAEKIFLKRRKAQLGSKAWWPARQGVYLEHLGKPYLVEDDC